jgi:hypothetical protein
MARIRTIKPEFFRSEDIGDLTPLARLLFIGLWTMADRDGRLLDRPRRISADIFPYDEDFDCETLLGELDAGDLIHRYEAGGQRCIQIQNFAKHQRPHPKEPPSVVPAEPDDSVRQSREKKLLTTEERDETSPGKVDLGMESGKGMETPPPAGAPAIQSPVPPAPWHAHRWLEKFGKAWCQKYQQLTYGQGHADAIATADLGDLLASLSPAERSAAERRADVMFSEYLESAAPGRVSARHPFKWFVADFQGLRVPKGVAVPAARGSPPRDIRIGHVRAEDCDHTATGVQKL